MKKLLSVLLAVCMLLALCACGGSSKDSVEAAVAAAEAASAAAEAAAAAAQAAAAAAAAATGTAVAAAPAQEQAAIPAPAAVDVSAAGEISVFWYTFGDVYLSSVRAALDAALDATGLKYQDYDANANQTQQTEQVQTAITKGSSLLIVNVVDTGSNDAAQNIIELARGAGIPIIFFNRSVEQSVIESYDKCVFVGTNYEEAGHMQGEMIGQYVLANYDALDLNHDGVISYVMFKGQEGNMEAIARTQYGVEDADKVLVAAGKAQLNFYDANNPNKYLVDQNGSWSAQAANDYMNTILSQYNLANNNMIELVIANNDDMANGAVNALQSAGFNNPGVSAITIPVFGVDATDTAKDLIDRGMMTGTIKQDAEGMANAIALIAVNYLSGADALAGIDASMLEGTWKVSSEIALHLAVYRENPSLGGLVHSHAPAGTAFASQGRDFDMAVSIETAVQMGVIPCAPYAVTGSPKLAENAAVYCKEYNGCLLEHHGVVTWGKDVEQALFRTECLEHTVIMYEHMLGLGEVRLLSEEQLDELDTVRAKFGITTGGRPKGRA